MTEENYPQDRNEVCIGPTSDSAGKASSCAGCPNQSACASGKFKDDKEKTSQEAEDIAMRLEGVKHILLILSGKGGVGKSTLSSQLAWTLSYWGFQVGILDIDICGPSVARMMGVERQEVRQSSSGWSPVYAKDNLSVMSIAFMLHNRDDAIIWRGPRKTGLIRQFLTDVEWDDLDYLIIDAPPGTSDEHISIIQFLSKVPRTHAIVVTTPQEISLLDVRKESRFAKKSKSPFGSRGKHEWICLSMLSC
ncbi:nucleotide binding protein [Reticulomyxa filosa]|uniref:Nucleotide binding protein n=1 Tax=Reticulomyxa filosa TaxID=46433 RepID=X6NL18_RETFI|nr:nucleotide binding protein [Reticulomyxa filosa]|eukprot:ETO26975.1 nucleotide binding protein [Reticulomyxa filosa]